MTVIAAAIDPDTRVVWMAADAGSWGNTTRQDCGPKITRLPVFGGSELLLGVAGLGPLQHVIRRHLDIETPPAPNLPLDGWADGIAEAIAVLAVDARPPLVGDDGFVNGCVLIAFRGQVWELNQQEAAPISSGYTAIGSGSDVALGYLMATRQPTTGPPHWGAGMAVFAAVEAACHWNAHCWVGPNGPQVERLDP